MAKLQGGPAVPDQQSGAAAAATGKGKGQATPLTINTADNRQALADARERINAQKAIRAAAGDKIKAEYAGLEALGMNRHAIKAALRLADMDEQQRAGYAQTQACAAEALQIDLDIAPADPAVRH